MVDSPDLPESVSVSISFRNRRTRMIARKLPARAESVGHGWLFGTYAMDAKRRDTLDMILSAEQPCCCNEPCEGGKDSMIAAALGSEELLFAI
jgi:hypothetical protein